MLNFRRLLDHDRLGSFLEYSSVQSLAVVLLLSNSACSSNVAKITRILFCLRAKNALYKRLELPLRLSLNLRLDLDSVDLKSLLAIWLIKARDEELVRPDGAVWQAFKRGAGPWFNVAHLSVVHRE